MSLVFQWVIAVAAVVACLAVLVQALILGAMYRALMEAQRAGKEAQTKFGPLVDRFDAFVTSGAKLLEDVGPRVVQITAESLRLVETARQHADRIGELVDDTSGRAKARIAQIDQTVEHAVQEVEHAGDAVKSVVMRPVKEVNGLVAGVKAALNTYAQGGNRNTPEHVTQDEEMFI
ncbi:MAG TPA: hypothetical protein VMR62_29745 [Bryobacteraceae bacterium]|jgi:ABC-type transporter Mla subunit MlaD|nr:hypothetical protein [Bryobacteraceae bacterium]